MEVKLLQEFDFEDKNSLFGRMDTMNDAIVKEIRESENSLYIVLHEFDEFQGPDGEVLWPYKELEIEYVYAKGRPDYIYLPPGYRPRVVTLSELIDWVNNGKVQLEMNTWMIMASGHLDLYFIVWPLKKIRKFCMPDIDIKLLPSKIIFRWMS